MKKLTQEWILALKSNDYKQGKGCLKLTAINEDTAEEETFHCCLGVACDIFDPSLWIKNTSKEHSFLGSQIFLPNIVAEELGFEVDDDAPFMIAFLQDIKGKTFSELADIIENHFSGKETIKEYMNRNYPIITKVEPKLETV